MFKPRTKAGIESWWGPDGFAVEVESIDLRVEGSLRYSMTAQQPDQVDFLKKAGMPLTSRHEVRFTEVTPCRRLA